MVLKKGIKKRLNLKVVNPDNWAECPLKCTAIMYVTNTNNNKSELKRNSFREKIVQMSCDNLQPSNGCKNLIGADV